MIKGRCMKCKEQKDMKNPEMHKTSRGGFMAKGKCIDCGCGMCKIMSKEDAEKAISKNEAKKAF